MSGPGPEHPERGARFKFVREEQSPVAAKYAVAILRPENELSQAGLTLDRENKTHEFTGIDRWSDWETKTANALARTLLKGDTWPRRLTRWKTEK